jgi:integrase
VPIPGKTSSFLKKLIETSPYQDPDDLVFWGVDRKNPIDHKIIAKKLYQAFKKIGISKEDRKERNITFHSWRHFFNSFFRTKIPDAKLQRMTGHKNIQMTEYYTHFRIEDFQDVLQIQEDFFNE